MEESRELHNALTEPEGQQSYAARAEKMFDEEVSVLVGAVSMCLSVKFSSFSIFTYCITIIINTPVYYFLLNFLICLDEIRLFIVL